MMTDLQARIAIAIACLLIAVAGAFGWFWFIDSVEQRGYDRAVAERKASDDQKLAEALVDTRKNETALRDLIALNAELRQKENDTHAKTIDALQRAARAGTERLRCPAAIPADPATNDPAAAGRPEPETRPGDILPEAAGDIFSIAASLRSGVLRENALIDAYNAAQATCNGPPK